MMFLLHFSSVLGKKIWVKTRTTLFCLQHLKMKRHQKFGSLNQSNKTNGSDAHCGERKIFNCSPQL